MDEREALEAMARIPKPIKWIIPDSVRTDHATHLLVQQKGTEFTLLFFEVQSPILTGTIEEQLAAMQKLEFAEAKCVSRIVMSVENVPLAANNFVQVLNNAMKLAMKGQEDANSEHTGGDSIGSFNPK